MSTTIPISSDTPPLVLVYRAGPTLQRVAATVLVGGDRIVTSDRGNAHDLADWFDRVAVELRFKTGQLLDTDSQDPAGTDAKGTAA